MILVERIQQYLGLVRFAHTVFALPFACMSALVAADGFPDPPVFGWILFCMVTARTSAMTFNRIVDRKIDSLNPRTQNRHLPTGKVSYAEALGLWIVSSILFIAGAAQLNTLAFLLSPVALLVINGYSFCKRFTSLSHLVLGLSLAIAPIGAWIAVTGVLEWEPVILAAGVMLWVAGFDVIYALMDEEFDKRTGLRSLVVALGRQNALRLAFFMHGLSIAWIGWFGVATQLGWIYAAGVISFAGLIVYEHSLVKPDDITKINIAFFNVNGVISIGLFCFTMLDIFL